MESAGVAIEEAFPARVGAWDEFQAPSFLFPSSYGYNLDVAFLALGTRTRTTEAFLPRGVHVPF